MAHFAEINDKNIVVQVIVVNNQELLDENGVEQEQKGIEFCQSLFGGVWLQTSYNGNIRKNYAAIGYTYRADLDAFVPKKPFNSWVLNEETANWEPPVPMPNDGNRYLWDESTQSWVLVPQE